MKFTLLFVFSWFPLSLSQNVENDPCTLSKTQSPGVCILIENCAEAIENLRKDQFPQTCGFKGVKPLVCCSKNNSEYSKPKPQSNITISQKKCKEYASYVFEHVQSPLLLPTNQYVKINTCEHATIRLIVGGTRARRREFPHMALIGFFSQSNNIEWLCGGSLISEQHILTTATCLNHKHGVATVAALGITQISEDDNRQEHRIIERIVHPQYHERSILNDIGILKLEHPVKINKFARPACLHTDFKLPGSKAIRVGWAKNISDHVLLSKHIVQFFNRTSCHNQTFSEENQICADGSVGDNSDCENFGGSILNVYHDLDDAYCMYDIIGLTSDGAACTGAHLYTKVSHHVKWIEKIVWADSS